MVVESIPPSAFLQPPPPGRCVLINPKPEGDIPRAISRTSIIESLPDELLIEILARLSAADIHDKARLVCRRWRRLIHSDAFVCEHLHRATSGLLLSPHRESDMWNPCKFVAATTQGRVEISELSCKYGFPVLCSCNGLVLGLREKGSWRKVPFIFNFATKCAFNLPNFLHRKQRIYQLAMAYAAASMAYKVVGTYLKTGAAAITHCAILTAGVDKAWRHVAVEGLSPKARWLLKHRRPLTTRGFVHWVSRSDGVSLNERSGIFAVSLNVETEAFTETPLLGPVYHQESIRRSRCLSTGEHLSLFVPYGDWSWEVWEMKPETWEWRKVLPNIDWEACNIQRFASPEDNVLMPVGWVRYPELLAFFVKGGHYCIIYDLDTKEFNSIRLCNTDMYHYVVQHKSSLVWWKPC